MDKAAGIRSGKTLIVLAILAANISLAPPVTVAQEAGKCTVYGTPQVSPTLVKLESGVNRSVYRRGKPIHVDLTLKAGLQGAYLPDFFGSLQHTCFYGFSAQILTLEGGLTNPNGTACTGGGLGWHSAQYVELKPGETRTWSIDLPTAPIAPGHYCLYAEYLTQEFSLGAPVALPSDETRIAKGHITATPIAIKIR
ncbi:MAG TPA: hypothetical protein VGN16_13515 [Acidobacteriaceae bacterium]|jgi:hypothetical protein